MTTRLFIGNLSYSTTERQLQDVCAAHGGVLSTSIVVDRETGSSRGFAFVEYESGDAAERAIGALNGAEVDGRRLVVDIARARGETGGDPDRGARPGSTLGRRG